MAIPSAGIAQIPAGGFNTIPGQKELTELFAKAFNPLTKPTLTPDEKTKLYNGLVIAGIDPAAAANFAGVPPPVKPQSSDGVIDIGSGTFDIK